MSDKNEVKIPFTILKEWHEVRIKTPAVFILKDEASYVRHFHRSYARFISPRPEPERVDFDKEQVIAICWGAKPTTAYGISASSITGNETEVIITIKTHVSNCAGQMFTYPAVVLKIPRIEGIKVIVTGGRIPPGSGKDFLNMKKDGVEVVLAEVYKERAPYVQFSLLNGSKVTPEALKGKVVVLYFWSTWCAPCLENLPAMEQVYQKYQNAGIAFFAVYCHYQQDYLADSLEKAKQHLTQRRYEIPLAFEFTPECGGIPRLVIIDKSGYIRVRGHLPLKEIEKHIESLLVDAIFEDAYHKLDTVIEKQYADLDYAKKIGSSVWHALEESQNDKISILAYLVEQADSKASIEACIALSARTQPPVMKKIASLQQRGHALMGYRFNAFNAVSVHADLPAILELASLPEVKEVSSLETSKHPTCV